VSISTTISRATIAVAIGVVSAIGSICVQSCCIMRSVGLQRLVLSSIQTSEMQPKIESRTKARFSEQCTCITAMNTVQSVLHSSRTSFIRKITTGIEWYQYHDVITWDWPLDAKPVCTAGHRCAWSDLGVLSPFDVLCKYIWRETLKRCTDVCVTQRWVVCVWLCEI